MSKKHGGPFGSMGGPDSWLFRKKRCAWTDNTHNTPPELWSLLVKQHSALVPSVFFQVQKKAYGEDIEQEHEHKRPRCDNLSRFLQPLTSKFQKKLHLLELLPFIVADGGAKYNTTEASDLP